MIFDKQTLFSDNQAIGDTAASTNVIDQGPVGTPVNGNVLTRDLGAGGPVPIRIQVTTTFADATSVNFAIQTSDAEAFGSGVVTLAQTGAIAIASLTQGTVLPPQYIPKGASKRYLRMLYTVAGTTETAGTVTAGLVFGDQTNG